MSKRVDDETPNGGAYSIMFMYDKDGFETDDLEKATHFVINEYTKDGDEIFRTYGFYKKGKSKV